MKRFGLPLLPLLAAALIAGGCGGDDANGGTSGSDAAMRKSEDDTMKGDQGDAMKAEAAMAPRGTRVKVIDSDYGRVIADSRGEAFYLFDKESSKSPRCYAGCATAWPPVLTKGKPNATAGAKQALLGTTKRTDGKLQITYAGHPLYYYVDDSPGKILCHDVEEFGGLWMVVKPNGEAARGGSRPG